MKQFVKKIKHNLKIILFYLRTSPHPNLSANNEVAVQKSLLGDQRDFFKSESATLLFTHQTVAFLL